MNATTGTLDNYWMPFTANRDFKADPRIFVQAFFVALQDMDDRKSPKPWASSSESSITVRPFSRGTR
jgi:hypothetical protein